MFVNRLDVKIGMIDAFRAIINDVDGPRLRASDLVSIDLAGSQCC